MRSEVRSIRDAAAWVLLDLRDPRSVVDLAVKLVAESSNDRIVLNLALVEPRRHDVLQVVEELLRNEGSSLPNEYECGVIVAREVCESIVRGEEGAVVGIEWIYGALISRVAELDELLLPFSEVISRWEDSTEDRASCGDDARIFAAQFVEKHR